MNNEQLERVRRLNILAAKVQGFQDGNMHLTGSDWRNGFAAEISVPPECLVTLMRTNGAPHHFDPVQHLDALLDLIDEHKLAKTLTPQMDLFNN